MDKDKDLTKIVPSLFENDDTWTEGISLEFKSSKGGLPKDLWPTYSAFANTRGGIIVLGVGDDRSIEGVENIEQREKEFITGMNNPQKCSVSLCSPEDIAVIALDGKQVLAIRVPQAECTDRPVFVNGIAYKRYGEADTRCSVRELDILNSERFIVTRDDYTEDDAILEGTTLDDIDLPTLNQYRNRLQSSKPDNPWSGKDNKDFLTALYAYRRDRKTGIEGLTLAGLLMFGNASALMELKPSLQLDYQEYDGSEGKNFDRRWIDRLENDGTWAGNLYQFFFHVLPKLTLGLKIPFVLDKSLLRVDESPAHIAVREALANALVHASYRAECCVKIQKTPSALTFENSGNLLLSEERMMSGGLSRCRNKRLQNMFRLIGVVDKAGSGVAKIIRGWMDLCLFPPQVSTTDEPDTVKWYLPLMGLVSKEEVKDILERLQDEQLQAIDSNDVIVIALLVEGEWLSNEALRTVYKIHSADMRKILSKLRNLGIVVSRGKSIATEYALNPKYLRNSVPTSPLGNSPDKGENSPGNSPDKGENSPGNSPDKGENSPGNSPDKGENSPGRGGNIEPTSLILFECLLPQTQHKVKAVRDSARYGREAMLSLILEICTGRHVSLLDLSLLLMRNQEHLRSYIQILIRSGELETRYSEKNHPDQAYRAAPRNKASL